MNDGRVRWAGLILGGLIATSCDQPRGAVIAPGLSLVREGIEPCGKLGYTIAAVGDVDADGYSDFAVSAPIPKADSASEETPCGSVAKSDTSQGSVYIVHGGPVWGMGLETVADYTQITQGMERYDYFGRALAGASRSEDAEGDLVVLALVGGSGGEELFHYRFEGEGGVPVLEQQIPAPTEDTYANVTLAQADLDNNELSDLLVGVVGADEDVDRSGMLFVYLADWNDESWTDPLRVTGLPLQGGSGLYVTTADFDNDGCDDAVFGGWAGQVAIVACNEGGEFAAQMLVVDEDATSDGYDVRTSVALWSAETPGPAETTAPGLLVVGEVISDESAKTAYSFEFSADMEPDLIAKVEVEQAPYGQGIPLSGGFDLDGDMLSDAIMGVEEFGAEGRAYILLSPDLTLQEVHPEGSVLEFGSAVAMVDDLNGDGLADAVIGAPESGDRGGLFQVFKGGNDWDGDGYASRPIDYEPRSKADLVDCDDNDSGINPGVEESPDATIDQNCDGQIGNGCGCSAGSASGVHSAGAPRFPYAMLLLALCGVTRRRR